MDVEYIIMTENSIYIVSNKFLLDVYLNKIMNIELYKLTYGRVNLIKTHKEIECPDEKTKKQLLEPSFVIQKLIHE